MLSTFNRNKSKLIIASLAAGFGVHLHTLAQAANDSGTLNINGQISSTTCVLNMGDTAATASGVKTLQLGSTAAPAAAGVAGATFGTAQSVVFTVTNANGTTCTFGGTPANTLWDIGLTPGTYQTVTAGGNVLLLSSGTSATGAAANVGVLLKGSFGTGVTTGRQQPELEPGQPTLWRDVVGQHQRASGLGCAQHRCDGSICPHQRHRGTDCRRVFRHPAFDGLVQVKQPLRHAAGPCWAAACHILTETFRVFS